MSKRATIIPGEISEQPLVTIVIPVYNTQDYLEDCLESVVNQTYKNIEVLIINDGSTDNSTSIINRYEATHNNFECFKQENSGIGFSRNKGIKHAKGKYIYFLDSDDMLATTAIETMVMLGEKHSLDIIMFDTKVIINSEYTGKRMRHANYARKADYSGIMKGYNLLTDFLDNREFYPSVYLYMTNTVFLRSTGILFPEGIIHEDEAFTFLLMLHAEKVMHVNDQAYIRRIRSNSIMTGENRRKSFIGYVKVIELLNNERQEMPASYQNIITRRLASLASASFRIYHSLSFSDRFDNKYEYMKLKSLLRHQSYWGIKYGWLLCNGYYLYRTIVFIRKLFVHIIKKIQSVSNSPHRFILTI